MALVACGGKDAQSLDDGKLGGHCYPNGTCNVGLSCAGGVCIAADAAVIPDAATDAGPDASICVDDSAYEPNDNTTTAWITPIDNANTVSLSSLAICPAGDKDTYSVMITSANQNLEMIVEYEVGGADLQGAILNSGGIAIANATTTTANVKRAYSPNLPTGIYYIQVSGPASGTLTTNNYKLNINVTGLCEPVSSSPPAGHHNPGMGCRTAGGCHNLALGLGTGAPEYSVAGTLYKDTAGTMPYPGGTVIVTVGATTRKAIAADNGNFWFVPALLPSPSATVTGTTSASACPNTIEMSGVLVGGGGDCNNCHRNGGTTLPVYVLP